MKNKIRLATKIGLVYLLIALLLHMNQLVNPHYVFLGIIIFKDSVAVLINSMIILAILLSMGAIIKKKRRFYNTTSYLFAALAINSAINTVLIIFVKSDIMSVIGNSHQSAAIYQGYLINQLLIFCISLLIIAYFRKNKSILKKI